MTGTWWEYMAIFLASGILCVVSTPYLMRMAYSRGFLDQPGGHKSHDEAVPFLGGVAIVLAFALAVLVVSLLNPPHSGPGEILGLFAVAVMLSIIGLLDDLRNVSPTVRVLAEAGAAVVIWLMGSGVAVSGVGFVDLSLTIFWVVGITNAFNLLDNMDGLAAGLATVSSLTIFAVAASNGQFLVAGLAVGLAGCTVGFLRHNRFPARVYMGDGGALFIGFLVSVLAIKLRFDGGRTVSALVPVLACSVAVFDTTLVTLSRLHSGLSPFLGGQDHVSHRLVKLGLPVPYAVGSIHVGAVGIGILTFVSSGTDPWSAWIIAGMIGLTYLAAGIVLLRVPVDRLEAG
ncbi:MAG: undecaprenyl/decaprenyl-phosphate alpha-N-acetylglucosaminyl 1-phosphate transferase [Gemmatimonadales bacterium]|nr:undecaprenyl/decaprenyl-phosphate alpha-N-acetylglucosaminyl 1-phosphate transferase [Gemmatimonadales bacterium]